MEFVEMKRSTSNWSNFCMLLRRAGLTASAGLSCLNWKLLFSHRICGYSAMQRWNVSCVSDCFIRSSHSMMRLTASQWTLLSSTWSVCSRTTAVSTVINGEKSIHVSHFVPLHAWHFWCDIFIQYMYFMCIRLKCVLAYVEAVNFYMSFNYEKCECDRLVGR